MSSPYTYLWIQDGIPVHRFLDEGPLTLEERLAPLVGNPAGNSEELTRAVASQCLAWLQAGREAPPAELGLAWERGVAALELQHGWRGPLALLLDALRGAFHAEETGLPVQERLRREAQAWLSDSEGEWDGLPLSPGARLPQLAALAEAATRHLQTGDTLLVQGWCAATRAALELAATRCRRLHVLATEGLPLFDGRQLALHFAHHPGLSIELAFDAALTDLCLEADRVWIASESLGASSLLARIGSTRLAAECEAEDVPLDWLACASALLPGGELPDRMHPQDSLLWVGAPGRIRLRTQWLEELSLPPRSLLCTDAGVESFADLATRALRLERAPRCAPVEHSDSITPLAAPARKPLLWRRDETSLPHPSIR
jgi:hypothetical protein